MTTTVTLSHRRSLPLEAALCVLVALLFYHPLLDARAIQSGGDSANLFWPIKIFIQDALGSNGVIPLWNPWSYLGVPLAASLQHAVFYPPERLLYALLPAHVAMNAGNLLHLALAGAGAWAWLRLGLLLPRVPAMACGALFPCTAWFWGQQEHINQLAAVSWMPWAALCWWLLLQGRITAGRFITAFSMITAVQFLTGHPQEAVYSHLFGLALVIGSLLVRPDRAALLRRIAAPALTSMVIAGLLVSLQLLPTLELSSHSRRQFPDPAYALSFSMPPDLFITYLSPHHFGSFRDGYFVRDAAGNIAGDPAGNPIWDRRAYGEYGLYIGVPMLLLALIGFFATRRRLTWGLAIITALALLLAMGGNTDPGRIIRGAFTEFPDPGWSLHEAFLALFPPAKGFRVPARMIVLATFALVTLAAFGFAFLLSHSSHRHRAWVAGGVCLALVAALYLPSRREKFHAPVDIRPALSLAGEMPEDIHPLDHRLYRLTMADDGRLVAERHRETTFAEGNPLFNRMLALQPHMNVVAGVPIVDGYEEGLAPTARYKDFLHEFNRNLRQYRPDADFLALLGVRHLYSDLPLDTDFYPHEPERSLPGRAVHRNPRARGAAFWMEAAEGVDLGRFDGPFWRGGDPLPEIRREAVDFGNLQAWGRLDELPALTTRMISPNRVRVVHDGEASPPGDALLAMGWFPGWVFADSRVPAPHLSAVHLHLSAAEHTTFSDGTAGWEVAYRPRAWSVGLFLSTLGLTLWAGIFGASLQRRRRRRP